MKIRTWVVVMAAWMALGGAAAAAPDSKRMERAKDYIAEEQWSRAIVELQAVADDPREANRDEALFWLAHSEHEMGDHPAAIQTIVRLESQFPKSRWVRPARSLRVEIAQRLKREDVLWAVVIPPPPPPAPRPPAHAPGVAPPTPLPAPAPPETPAPPAARALMSRLPRASTPPPTPPPAPIPGPVPPTPAAAPDVPPAVVHVRPARGAAPVRWGPGAPVALLPGAEYFLPPTPYPPDTDLQIEALNGLLEQHGERVIPLLREIALDGNSPDDARRAILVLARSARPEARRTVTEVAHRGPEPVQLAAIRAMGRFDGDGINTELMQVYSSATTPRVKRQVVSSLGERADNVSLLRIAKVESDAAVRNVAIVTLGRLPDARPQLRTLYGQAPQESRMSVLAALFSSKDEDELIRIATIEKEPMLRARARMQLRLLATPKALKFLTEHP
jgi:hypothetical protein